MKKENFNELKNKTIILVNAGSLKKKFIIQKLKKLGLKIIALDEEKKSWAEGYVSQWVITNNKNHPRAISDLDNFLAANPKIKPDGVYTYWEDDVLLTSKIAERLGLIGIPSLVANKARNKYLFRKFCEENKINFPNFMLTKSQKDIDYVIKNFSFPVVVKPTYGSSSAFVVKANNKEELLETYQYIRKNISVTTESALSEGLDIMVEEYIDGEEVDMDILVQNGKIKYYSVVDNYQTEEPFFIETRQAIPSQLPDDDQDDLIEMAEKVLEKLGVQNGCIHFEAKSTKNGPVPLEVNLRIGGDETYMFSREAWHVDLIENGVKIALGIYVDKVKRAEEPFKYLISNTFTPEYSGLLSKLDIDESVKTSKYVEDLVILKKVGDPVLVPPEGYEYLGWATVSGDNPLDAENNLEELLENVEYEVVKFAPTSSVGKTLRKNRFSMASVNKNMVKAAAKIETIKRLTISDKRKLHIGIAGNLSPVNSLDSNLYKTFEETLKNRGYKTNFFDLSDLSKTFNEIKNSNVDLVFNICKKINNTTLLEPHIASLFDVLQIPYTGSNPITISLCSDKIRAKKLLTFHKIPTPKWDYAYDVNDEINEELEFPLIIKPANKDDSIGINNKSVVTNKKELRKQIKELIEKFGCPVLVEEYIEGDEYDVPIIGNNQDDLRVLPLSRTIFDKLPKNYWHIYPDDKSWKENKIYNKVKIQEPSKSSNNKLESLISEIALDAYNILDCHDYGHVEVKVDKNNNPYVLELNCNPVLGQDDYFNRSAKLAGISYGDLLEEIIKMTINRYKNKPRYYHLQTDLI